MLVVGRIEVGLLILHNHVTNLVCAEEVCGSLL